MSTTVSALAPANRTGWLVRVVGAFGLVVLLGVSSWVAGWNLWADHHLRAARQAQERHDLAQARAHLELYLELRPNSAAEHFEAGRVARRTGDFDGMDRHLAAARKLGWPEQAIGDEATLAAVQRGQIGVAHRSRLRGAVDAGSPDSAVILEALAQGYLRTFEIRLALDCLEEYLQRDPDDARALLWQGESRERLRDVPGAKDSYGHAVELDPDNEDAHLRLANLLIGDQSRAAEALAHYQFLEERRPGDPAVLLGLARCHIQLGDSAEAVRILDDLVRAYPGDAQALGERGRLAIVQGATAEAEGLLRRAIEVDPHDAKLCFALARCLERQGNETEARRWDERRVRIEADLDLIKAAMNRVFASPQDPALRTEVGAILLRNGQEREADRWLRSALDQDSHYEPARRLLARRPGGDRPPANP
jgi:Flp pilus assembly protein TadD